MPLFFLIDAYLRHSRLNDDDECAGPRIQDFHRLNDDDDVCAGPRIQDFHRLENACVVLVGRASEVLECARAFKRPRIQFKKKKI